MHPWTASSIPDFIFFKISPIITICTGNWDFPTDQKKHPKHQLLFQGDRIFIGDKSLGKTQRPNCSFQYKTLVLWWVLESQIINADINYKVLEKPADVKNNTNLSVGFKCKVIWKP